MRNELQDVRRKKIDLWPEIENFKPNQKCNVSDLEIGSNVSVAGRIIFFRDLGKIVFGRLKDFSGSIQFSLTKDLLSDFDNFKSILDIGDIIGIEGKLYKTQAGELTIQVEKLYPLRKSINPFPDKWGGIQDADLKLRLRYIDIAINEEMTELIRKRFKIIQSIKNFFFNREFLEVETPVLQPIPSGAAAKPFKTHHAALDMDLYLRICPELYLKRLIIAGVPRVFEIAKCFRNEGIDPTHLQEFTMLEMYYSYLSYEEGMDLAIELLQTIAKVISSDLKIGEMDFNHIPKISYKDFLKTYGDLDFDQLNDPNYIEKIVTKHNIDISDCKSSQALLDTIYKHTCVKKIISPILVYDYPRHALASVKKNDPRFSEQFQVIVRGMEVIKAYSELNDPDILEENFANQKKMADQGDEETVRTDDEFVDALRYGMPPTVGLGMGIDRIIFILTGCSSIRDVIIFNQLKDKII